MKKSTTATVAGSLALAGAAGVGVLVSDRTTDRVPDCGEARTQEAEARERHSDASAAYWLVLAEGQTPAEGMLEEVEVLKLDLEHFIERVESECGV